MSEPIRVGDRVTIYPRGKKGTYCADFWHNNKHHRQSLKTRNRKVAEQRAVQLANTLIEGTFKAPPPVMTIRQAVDLYIRYLETEGRARKTVVRYRGELFAFRDYLEGRHVARLGQLTVALFDDFRVERKKDHGPRSMFHEAVVIKQWLKWCVSRRWLPENPLASYKLSKPKLERRGGPSLDQVNQILKAAKEPTRTQLALLAFTGARSGEVQRLRPEDVDLDGGWIKVVSRPGAETKTRQSRKVPIHARLRPLLEAMSKRKRPWFFTARPSRKYPTGDHWLNPKRVNETFLGLIKSLKLPAGRGAGGFTIHSLRHFFETFCTNNGTPQRVVDAWLGHTGDQSMGANYYKLSDEDSQSFMLKVPFGTGEPAASAGDTQT
jgi:integrase